MSRLQESGEPPTNLLTGLLPDSVVVVERFTDAQNVELYAEELAVIERAVPKRRSEFATVRHCARLALSSLGFEPVPLVPGRSGAPAWPEGAVGSMTHCDGYRAAAIARQADASTVGIDAEPHGPLPEGVLDLVSLPAERHRLARLVAARPTVHWDRVLFSAKESVYKAWFPLTHQWLGFEEADLVLDPDGEKFEAVLSKEGPAGTGLYRMRGRWKVAGGFVATAVVAPPVLDEARQRARG